MNYDLNFVKSFKKTIEDIVKNEIKKQKIMTLISGVVHSVNNNGTVNVYLPPNENSILTGLLNKTGESLSKGDSVEIMTKGGNLSNSWVMIKHNNNTNL